MGYSIHISEHVPLIGTLASLISAQCDEYSHEYIAAQLTAKSEIKTSKRNLEKEATSVVRDLLPGHLQRAMDVDQDKGALSWLTSISIEKFGFSLHKSVLRDAIALR